MKNHTFLIALILVVLANKANARFNHLDADQIDPEPDGREIVIDAKSYEFLESSKKAWKEHKNGYRVSPGSLNANRFHLRKDIKLYTDSDSAINFSYYRHSVEDLSEIKEEEEIRLDWNFSENVYLTLLADGNTHKKHGDVGIAFGVGKNPSNFFEIYYYRVDLYYSTKETLPDSYYSRFPWTLGVRFDDSLWHGIRVRGKAEFDSPTQWQRGSLQQEYHYFRRYSELELKTPPSNSISYALEVSYDHKIEALKSLPSISHEALERRSFTLDTYGVLLKNGYANYDKFGMQFVRRATNNQSTIYQDSRFKIFDTSRTEATAYYLKYHPYANYKTVFFQWGLYVSEVYLQLKDNTAADRLLRGTEVKLQTAWEVILGRRGSVVFNCNWNIDSLARNFPYENDNFHPWNGGNIQFQVQL